MCRIHFLVSSLFDSFVEVIESLVRTMGAGGGGGGGHLEAVLPIIWNCLQRFRVFCLPEILTLGVSR